jgi:hypothetical protein
MSAIELRRIDPARNMRRFYRLDIEPDTCSAAFRSRGNGLPRRVNDEAFASLAVCSFHTPDWRARASADPSVWIGVPQLAVQRIGD